MGKLLLSVVAAITCVGSSDAHACCVVYSVVFLPTEFFVTSPLDIF
jgi:hypothetical protein